MPILALCPYIFDVVQCLRALGQMPSPTEIQDHMAIADPNNTGFFSYKDLAQVDLLTGFINDMILSLSCDWQVLIKR